MTALDDWPAFLGLTVVLFGGAAWLTGQAIADTWRSAWQVAAWALLLAGFDRFLHWGLFGGELLSMLGLVRDYAVILAVGLVAYRITRVERTVRQYPWLYAKRGPFLLRER